MCLQPLQRSALKSKLTTSLLQPTLLDLQNNADALDKLDVKASAEEIGIRPADFIQAIIADPELSKVCVHETCL